MNYDFAMTVIVENLYNSENDINRELLHEAVKYLVENTDCKDTALEYLEEGDFTYYESDLNISHTKQAKEKAMNAFLDAQDKANQYFIKGLEE